MSGTRIYNAPVAMRDGVVLASDVYLPAGADDGAPVRTIVGRTPYNKNNAAYPGLAERWNQRGWALVVGDVRGRGDSDGSFVPYVNEGADGHDTIEWVAAQPWSNGDVVLMGASYGARAGWLTALTRPAHLRALVASVSPSDPFVEFPNGQSPMMVSWYRLVQGRMLQHADSIDWMSVYEHLPLATMDEAAGFTSPFWKDSLVFPLTETHGELMSYQHRYRDVDVPVLHISGWYDDEQIGTPRNFRGMVADARSETVRAGQRLLMGPWGHAVNAGSKLGEVDFGPDAVIDLEGDQARWLDEVLGGGTATVPLAPVRIFVMGDNVWRDEQEWPLARTVFTDWFLHSDGAAHSRLGTGRLDTVAPAGDERPDTFTYDPARPVPFITEPRSSQLGGPDDYAAVELRGDVLCFTSAPLEEDTEVTGPVQLVLHVSSTAVDTDFTAMLLDVHPSGFCQRLCDSMVRMRYRDGHDAARPMDPGTVYEVVIDLWNTSQVFVAGHRIRLDISSSAFPKYDRNLNTGEAIDTGTRWERAENTVWHDAVRPSRLVLPIIPR